MELKIVKENNEHVVFIEGRVDTASATELEDQVKLLYDVPSLIFDCTNLEYISSSGLRVILKSYKTMASQGSTFILRHLTKEVRSVIDLTGFSRILTIE